MKTISRLEFFMLIVTSLLGWSLFLSSCSTTETSTVTKEAPETPRIESQTIGVGKSADEIKSTANNLAERAGSIDVSIDDIFSKVPEQAKPAIKDNVTNIKKETDGIRKDQLTLEVTEQKLREIQVSLLSQQKLIEDYTAFAKDTEVERTKLQDKIKELESSKAKMLNTMLAWISVCCVIGIGVSLVIGFYLKTPAAFMVAAGCLATLGISVAVTIYMQWIALVAVSVFGLGFVGAVVYIAIQLKNKNKAVSELVHTGEVLKTYLPSNSREKIFGNSVEPGVAHQIQSESTIKIIKDIRDESNKNRGFGLAPSSSFSKQTSLELNSNNENNSKPISENTSSYTNDSQKRTILG